MTNIVDDWFERGATKGKLEGRAEGRAEGKLEGQAEALLMILTERRVTVSETQRATILRCRDLDQLSAWLRKALTAQSPDEFLPEVDLH